MSSPLQDPIPTSLLKINSDLVSRATKLFHLILKYMGVDSSDRSTPPSLDERIELVGKLFKKTLKRVELRDELFAQISKQTRHNPDRCIPLFLSRTYHFSYMPINLLLFLTRCISVTFSPFGILSGNT